ncbi:MAG: radical SAM protein [Actinobacteria bacterium]|nr:radical SAM protein [Actinomycetota bacterium]
MTRYRLATEVFSLPRGGEHLVYAPLLQTSVVVNGAALNLLANIAAERAVTRDARTRDVLDLLLELQLIGKANGRRRTGDAPPASPSPAGGDEGAAAELEPAALRPTAVTLFLTSACNLRCIYCYASGGEQPRYLDEGVARDAIDFIVDNAVADGQTKATVTFHGGGEPTLAGTVMKRCVEHARRRCAEHDLELSTGTATNGVMSDAMRDYLAENMTSVMVSIDGPAAVQDLLRPQADGGPSSAAVERTLARLSASDCTLGTRLTCTTRGLEHAEETVRHLVDAYRLNTIHLEPLFACGRSVGNGLQPPSAEHFVDVFRACREYAGPHGVEVAYSGAHQASLACSFCQVSRPSFNITTEGDVTACYEITGRDDPRAETFIYGSHDPEQRSFVFHQKRIAALRRLTVNDAPRCARCFAKYHCAGDCPSKRLYPGADDAVVARCAINRRLTLDQLEEVIRCPTTSAAAI